MKGTVSTLNNKWYPVPNIYMSMPFAKRYAFGVGVFAPYGLTTDWPETSQGRYLGYKSVVQGVYIQPTFAVKLNDKVSIGVGVDITYLNVELRQRVDLSTQLLPTGATFAALGVTAGTDFADVQLKGNTWHAGYHLGALVKANDRFSIGVRFLSGQKVDINNGTITTTQIPASSRTDAVHAADRAPRGPGRHADGRARGVAVRARRQAEQPDGHDDDTAARAVRRRRRDPGHAEGEAVRRLPVHQLEGVRRAADQRPVPRQSTIVENYGNVSGVRIGTEIGIGAKSGSAPASTSTGRRRPTRR